MIEDLLIWFAFIVLSGYIVCVGWALPVWLLEPRRGAQRLPGVFRFTNPAARTDERLRMDAILT